jgi:hypothetical protein
VILGLLFQVGAVDAACNNQLARLQESVAVEVYAEAINCLAEALSELRELVNGLLPKGTVIAYGGRVMDLPTGWSPCDGTEGRPDLGGRFVLGAGSAEDVGSTGGESTHTHLAEIPRARVAGPFIPYNVALGRVVADAEHRHAVEVRPTSNIPPYMKLTYICNGDWNHP